MKNKILIIGDYNTNGADTCKWDGQLLNLIDYEIIIIDTSCLFKIFPISPGHSYTLKQWPSEIVSNFEYISKKLLESILIDTQVFVLFYPKSVLSHYGGGWPRSMGTNDWFPLTIETHVERGTLFTVNDKKYKEYFQRLKGWTYYYLPQENDDDSKIHGFHGKNNIVIKRKIIAVNKLGQPISVEIGFSKLIGKDYIEQESRIILLPLTNNEESSGDIDTIISLNKYIEHIEAPDWIDSIFIPNEVVLKEEMDAVESKLKEKSAKYNSLIEHKKLLYDYSYSLQNICELTLRELGANIKPSVVSDEFIIEFDGIEALVEVKGSNRSIDKDDLGQLVVDVGQHLRETGKSIKGLLLGNGWRNMPPPERESGNHQTFPKEIVKAAENNNVGLLSSMELYKAYCQVLEEKLSKDDFLRKIFSSNGVIRFELE